MKLLVLGGGESPESEVSLRSAKAVADAARNAGFEVEETDPKNGLGILDSLPPSSIVFSILHGKNGEDGVIQKELERRRLAFLGSDSRSSAECFDKWLTRQKLTAASISMPEGVLVSKKTYRSHPTAKEPHVLKVQRGGSSIGVILAKKQKDVSDAQLNELFELDTNAVLEKYIDGKEITVPILGQQALPVIEIVPPAGEAFDYENKYNGRTDEICPPLSVSAEQQQKAQRLAEDTHRVMGCRHLSRVDMMIDKDGNLYVLEINTMPGLTSQSLYPRSAAAAGLSMSELVKKFAEMVQSDYSL